MNGKKYFLIAAVCLVAGRPGARALPVGSVLIEGAKSEASSIRKFLDTREGAEFDAGTWDRDVQRIRNLDFFYDLESAREERNGQIHLRLKLKNKFSLIPILKYKQGGGTSLLTAGAYEVNFLNRLLEVGAQYENLKGKHGAVGWFRHPYFLSRKNNLGAELYVHTVDLPLLTLKGETEAYYDNRETRWNLRFLRERSENIHYGGWVAVYQNDFSADNDTVEKSAKNAVFGAERMLRSGRTVSLLPRILLGRINRDRFYVRGFELALQGELSHRSFGSQFDFVKGETAASAAFRPLEKLNVAFQFQIGTKSGQDFQHKFYLGGLDSVRGFLDGQFRGNHMWRGNFEVRPTLMEGKHAILQGNLFSDWAKTWDGTRFSSDGFADPFISYGAGVRVILPAVYRAVLRADMAWTQEPMKRSGFSLGLQQFF